MARIALQDMFVVTYRHTDGYSFDTGTPDEVFSTREEAQTYADECNELTKSSKLAFMRTNQNFYVEPLSDRLQTIKDECVREGEHNERSRT
jgi:hypothetical protein